MKNPEARRLIKAQVRLKIPFGSGVSVCEEVPKELEISANCGALGCLICGVGAAPANCPEDGSGTGNFLVQSEKSKLKTLPAAALGREKRMLKSLKSTSPSQFKSERLTPIQRSGTGSPVINDMILPIKGGPGGGTFGGGGKGPPCPIPPP